jgi:hypothetical protein
MFIQNKYHSTYFRIINRAKARSFNSRTHAKKILGYVEQHHIIPKCLGGLNIDSNLVYLSAREHFVCHLLLVRFTVDNAKKKMIFALNKMTRKSKNQNRHIPTSHQYDKIRTDFANSMSEINKGSKRPLRTPEQKDNVSKKLRGVSKSEQTIKNMIKSWNDEERKKQLINRNKKSSTLALLWKDDEFRKQMIKNLSDGMSARLSDPINLVKAVSQINTQKICEKCDAVMNVGNYKRWHGINCKKQKSIDE